MLIDADTILQINSKWPLNVYYKEISHIYQANKKKKISYLSNTDSCFMLCSIGAQHSFKFEFQY